MAPTLSAVEVVAEITGAFENEPYPGEWNIVYDNSDYDIEVKRIRETFKVHTWQTLPDELMQDEQYCFSFLEKKGLKYYLPAFMVFAVRDYTGSYSIPDNIIFQLTLPAEMDVVVSALNTRLYRLDTDRPISYWNEYYQSRLLGVNGEAHDFIDRSAQFSPAQGRAILHFLEYMRDEYGEDFLRDQPNIAIERYWFQFA